MLPNRYGPANSLSTRKSRLEGKQSLIPRRPGSIDRASIEARRPSTAGGRSSSAEPPRATFGGRLSRETSATKLTNRPRSQTGESKFGQFSTPLRSSHFSRPTVTPVRTPDDRSRSWEVRVERALAYLTVKDQRPIANIAWQRAEVARVSEALSGRGSSAALMRPLTIARFVEIVGELLTYIMFDPKLTTDNYVAKLPHLSKRLLYPSAVSKSWLRAVNTLHAFPHALALIGYLLDVGTHCKMPLSKDMLYVNRDKVSILRYDYLNKCYVRFQEVDSPFNDLKEEYLKNLKSILGNNDDKIMELQQDIKKMKSQLEGSGESEARAEEARLAERRDALVANLRSSRAARRQLRAELDAAAAARAQRPEQLRLLDADIERASAELDQLRGELAAQPMSVEERTRLLDQVEYERRVYDTKLELTDQVAKLLLERETELAQMQKQTLLSCVGYKQLLVQLRPQLPALANLAVEEKELMGAECAGYMAKVVETLREQAAALSARKAELVRAKSALDRKRAVLKEETRAKIAELKCTMERERRSLEEEQRLEAAEAAAWCKEQQEIKERLQQLRSSQEEYDRVAAERDLCEQKVLEWRKRLSELHEYIESQRALAQRRLAEVRVRRQQQVRDTLAQWRVMLDRR